MLEKIIVGKRTPVLNTQKPDNLDILEPGEYVVIQIKNPFNVDCRDPLKPWLAIFDRPHIGQIREAWESFNWITIINI
jgi:hypothetical protein